MISTLANVFYWVTNIGIYSIILSYKTGKFIVSTFITCADILRQLVNTVWMLLTILNEDLLVFIFDVWNKLSFMLRTIIGSIEVLGDMVSSSIYLLLSVIPEISNFIVGVYQVIVNMMVQVIFSIGRLFTAAKQLIVLFGSGMWFALTIVPITLVYLTMLMFYSVGRIFEEILTGANLLATSLVTNTKVLVNFIIDVPLESIAGLLSCACLAYAIFRFNFVLYGRMRYAAFCLLDKCANLYTTLSRTLLATGTRQIIDESTETSEDEDRNENERSRTLNRRKQVAKEDNRLCIICMDRNKCMLAMPCRHLCTCSECQHKLERYSRTCPMCRRPVSYTIHVY